MDRPTTARAAKAMAPGFFMALLLVVPILGNRVL
jgi:hypothetical protein